MTDLDDTRRTLGLLLALSRLDGARGEVPAPQRPAPTAVQRLQFLQQLPLEVRRQYERLFDSGRRPTVVLAAGGYCQGCHMRIPPSLMQLLARGELVCRCPSCHRFLVPDTQAPFSNA